MTPRTPSSATASDCVRQMSSDRERLRSKRRTSNPEASSRAHKWLPMRPSDPVTKIIDLPILPQAPVADEHNDVLHNRKEDSVRVHSACSASSKPLLATRLLIRAGLVRLFC